MEPGEDKGDGEPRRSGASCEWGLPYRTGTTLLNSVRGPVLVDSLDKIAVLTGLATEDDSN